MAFVTLEDTTGGVEVIVFPKTLAENPTLFYEGNIVLIRGRVSVPKIRFKWQDDDIFKNNKSQEKGDPAIIQNFI